MNIMNRMSLVGALVAASFGVCSPTVAEDVENHVTVNYSDLNINNPAGAEVLYRRIQKAARKVCAYNPDEYWEARTSSDLRTCYLKAVTEAVAKVNSAPLKALHVQKTGKTAQG